MRVFVLLSLLFLGSISKGQLSINYYPFQSIASLSSDSEKKLWIDLRVESNTFISNLNFELDAMYNFKRDNYYNAYAGLGYNFNPFYGLDDLAFSNGYLLHMGIRLKPWQKHKALQIGMEISPYFNANFDGAVLRSLLGITYNFKLKENG